MATLATPLSKLMLTILFILNSIPSQTFACPVHQKQALQFKSTLTTIYNSNSNSDPNSVDFIPFEELDSWNPKSDYRVKCTRTRNKTRPVTELHLSEVVPLFINPISVFSNILTPLFGIRSLKLLDISMNSLVGEISGDGFANLTGLVHLDMMQNSFNGTIPRQLFKLTNLRYLDMSSNSLEGELGPVLGSLRNLNTLSLSMNYFNGSMPPELFQLESLCVLDLSNNTFQGGLSSEVGKLQNLDTLKLNENFLLGNIPEEIGNLTKLREFSLGKNKFSGRIPPSIAKLKKLESLDLSENSFSGQIPAGRRTTERDNPRPEQEPVHRSNPVTTQILSMGGNKFSGDLPWNLTNLVKLELLDLHDNDITGKFHDVLPKIQTLQVLSLRNNSLEGFIPKTISDLSSLRILDLSGNSLTGSIPLEIGYLTRMIKTPDTLVFVDIFSFSTEFQDLILNWKNYFQGLSSRRLEIYSFLDLSDNRISGEIPETLGNLEGLKLLNISQNRITGNIPESFGNLKGIESLDLSRNEISGSIPQSLSKLDQLAILDVSNNKLTGRIPIGGQMSTINDLNYYQNNSGLCGMQIRIICPEDVQHSKETEVEDDDKLSWISWEGTWFGFPVGFFSSILIMGYSLNFLQLFKFW